MAQDPFPRSALDDNRAGRLTAEQIRGLRVDARESKRSGVLAGIALLAFGLVIVWGTFAGRVPGSRLQSFAVGAVIAVVGGLMLASRGMTRGPRAAEAASESTVLDVVEGPFRRERVDRQILGSTHSSSGSARYLYYLYIGDRRLSVGEPAYDAAPDNGVVRAYLLPSSDRIVNLERIADAPPTPIELRAAAVLRERFGAVLEGDRPSSAKNSATTPAALRAALLGRWQAQGMPLRLEFRADGTVVSGGEGAAEAKRWEVLDAGRIRIDGEDQRVEVDGDDLSLATRGPTFRFHRVRNF
jgi:hypothetical protein